MSHTPTCPYCGTSVLLPTMHRSAAMAPHHLNPAKAHALCVLAARADAVRILAVQADAARKNGRLA